MKKPKLAKQLTDNRYWLKEFLNRELIKINLGKVLPMILKKDPAKPGLLKDGKYYLIRSILFTRINLLAVIW